MPFRHVHVVLIILEVGKLKTNNYDIYAYKRGKLKLYVTGDYDIRDKLRQHAELFLVDVLS